MKINKELTKLYYSIGEVAEMFSVSNSLIRYWETEFSILKPQKNRKGDRRYRVKDIRIMERIYTLVKERGFTLEGARKELSVKKVEVDKNLDNPDAIKARLGKVLVRLESLLSRLEG